MKERDIIVLIAVLSLFGAFFLVYGAQGNYLAVIGQSVFDGWATFVTTSLSVRIGCFQIVNVLDSGSINMTDECFNGRLISLSNLTSGWQVTVTAHGNTYPADWTEAEPNSTEAGTTKFDYFRITVNQTVPNSNYMIFFNLTQAYLGDVIPENVSLFMYNNASTSWVNLTTEVVDGTSDPAQFFGIAQNFGKFLIGQKVPGTEQQAEPGAPGGVPGQTGTPGGGGGGVTVLASDFDLSEELIAMTLVQEQGKTSAFTITNIGEKKLDVSVEAKGLEGLVTVFSEDTFSIDVGGSKTVRVDVFAPTDTKPLVYIGKIVVTGNSIKKTIPIIIEVKERKPLFDIKLTIDPTFKEVASGQTLTVFLLLQNLGLRGTPVDVSVVLSIVDLDKKVLIQSSKEVIRVTDDTYTQRELNVPKSTPAGKYLVIGQLEYAGITVEVYDTFDVVGEAARVEVPLPAFGLDYNIVTIALLVMIAVITMTLLGGKYARRKKSADATLQGYYQIKAELDKSMPQLIEYIRMQRRFGYSKEGIMRTLTQKGWPKAIVAQSVEKVFSEWERFPSSFSSENIVKKGRELLEKWKR